MDYMCTHSLEHIWLGAENHWGKENNSCIHKEILHFQKLKKNLKKAHALRLHFTQIM